MWYLEKLTDEVLQEVNLLNSQVGGRLIIIWKYSFDLLSEWLKCSKSKISYCIFVILLVMKNLLKLYPVVPTDPLSNMLKTLRLDYPGLSYVMINIRIFASFQHILASVFGGDSASVLTNFTKP